jgi:hypothetical protein
MSWNDDEGPWGPSGGNKPKDSKPQNPEEPIWIHRNKGGSNGPGGFSPPPDFQEFWRKLKDFLSPYKPQGLFRL